MTDEFIRYEVPLTGPSAPLQTHLRRFGARAPGAPAVVLLHGGNTSGDTFLVPAGGLVRFLTERNFDVWVLEWRSSPHVVGPLLRDSATPLGGSVQAECRLFTLDRVVEDELPTALAIVRGEIKDAELSLLGHCFGSATVSIAVARGAVEPFGVSNLVLSTLGLFVEAPWSGWVKAEDFIMERVLHDDPRCRSIDPHDPDAWATDMKTAFAHWPKAWLPGAATRSEQLLQRLSFMFGQPYSIDRLHWSLQCDGVERFFGPMHLGLFLHASQMVRRGFAARFDAPDIVDRPRLHRDRARAGRPFENDLVPTHFRDKRVTLLAGGENHLWHRESIDLMYEWLRAIPQPRTADLWTSRYTKRVFPDYNLQELMWGANARRDVFPAIEYGLRPPARRPRAAASQGAPPRVPPPPPPPRRPLEVG